MFLVFLTVLCLIWCENKVEYAIVIDAGSTSSKLKVYYWEDFKKISQVSAHFEKMHPLASYLEKSYETLKTELTSFISQAIPYIPNQKDVSFSLGATAGLRLLPVNDSEYLIDKVRTIMTSVFSFNTEDRKIRVLSGEEEGIFGWITVQYLSGDFEFKSTAGALDMGGASTQISFIPLNQQILADKKTIRAYDSISDVYSHSFLRYGMNEAFDQVNQNIVNDNHGKLEFAHPCLFNGYNSTIKGHKFYGTSDVLRCREEIMRILRLGLFCQYPSGTCSVDSDYVPIVPSKKTEMKFYAFSGFEYMPSGLNLPSENLKLSKLNSTAFDFCQRNFTYANETSGMDVGYVWNQCFNVIYGLELLLEGYNFDPEESGQVIFDGKVGGIDVGWALGSLIYEVSMFENNEGGQGKTKKETETKKDYVLLAPMIIGFSFLIIAVITVVLLLMCLCIQCLLLITSFAFLIYKHSIKDGEKVYEEVNNADTSTYYE